MVGLGLTRSGPGWFARNRSSSRPSRAPSGSQAPPHAKGSDPAVKGYVSHEHLLRVRRLSASFEPTASHGAASDPEDSLGRASMEACRQGAPERGLHAGDRRIPVEVELTWAWCGQETTLAETAARHPRSFYSAAFIDTDACGGRVMGWLLFLVLVFFAAGTVWS